jgi:hypothetical protein
MQFIYIVVEMCIWSEFLSIEIGVLACDLTVFDAHIFI